MGADCQCLRNPTSHRTRPENHNRHLVFPVWGRESPSARSVLRGLPVPVLPPCGWFPPDPARPWLIVPVCFSHLPGSSLEPGMLLPPSPPVSSALSLPILPNQGSLSVKPVTLQSPGERLSL